MLARIFFVLVCSAILVVIPGGEVGKSQAHFSPEAADQSWKEWESVSLQLLKSEELCEYFEYLHRRRRFNGAVLIAEKGTILHAGAYGWANQADKELLSMNSAFQLASVSKVFTATAIMLLHQQGKLNVDDEVSKHLSGWPYKGMTIRHLLSHRSGMGRYMAVAGQYWRTPRKAMSNEDVLRIYRRRKPVIFFRAGKGFNYCNTNYVFLASIVEHISGKSFRQFMHDEIFQPLDMEDAMIYSRVDDPEIPHEAIGYKVGRRGYYRAYNDYIDGVVGDKNMYASVMDLFKFDQAIWNGKLLNEETLALMTEPNTPGNRVNNYGLGWRMKKKNGHTIPYHFGWWRGFRTCMLHDPEGDRTIIVLTNRDHPGLNVNYWRIYEKLLSLDMEPINWDEWEEEMEADSLMEDEIDFDEELGASLMELFD
ncbi:serine hydrolase domain-containing protein [Pontibacter sp. G13]|uniref:serine hydrolase domain-containing protein n=1 Tax=Pontibacter sp. G13 TaxID=3074898 RepID=UPI00288B0DCE|nr:serine hydrolase domain-containing protein [Pontibacter sp. G13]WNJ16957.1 serine hydrolase domain-containing protein [Pontibacter sp. G13]